MINVTPLFWKSPVFKTDVFRPHETERKAGVFILMSAFETLRFADGLVWTVDLTAEIKLRFQTLGVARMGLMRSKRTSTPDTSLISLAIHGKLH